MPKTLLYVLGAFVAWKVFGGDSSSSSSASSSQAAADAAAHQRALDEAAAKAAAGASQNNTVSDIIAVGQIGASLVNSFANAFAKVSSNAAAGRSTETKLNPDDPGWG